MHTFHNYNIHVYTFHALCNLVSGKTTLAMEICAHRSCTALQVPSPKLGGILECAYMYVYYGNSQEAVKSYTINHLWVPLHKTV